MAPRAEGPQPWKVLARSEATAAQAEQPPEEEVLEEDDEGGELDSEGEVDGDDEELCDELPDDSPPLCEPTTVAARVKSIALWKCMMIGAEREMLNESKK